MEKHHSFLRENKSIRMFFFVFLAEQTMTLIITNLTNVEPTELCIRLVLAPQEKNKNKG